MADDEIKLSDYEKFIVQLTRYVPLIAFEGVVNDTVDYKIRHIYRWYSREFNTPLHVVYDLDPYEILLNFFECRYENQEWEEQEETRQKLVLTEEERIKKETEEASKKKKTELDDEAFLRDVQAKAATFTEPKKPAKSATPQEIKDPNPPMFFDRPTQATAPQMLGGNSLPSAKPEDDEFSIDTVSEEKFNAIVDNWQVGIFDKKKKR